MKTSSLYFASLLVGLSGVAQAQTQTLRAPESKAQEVKEEGDEGLTPQGLLAIAKVTGACGIMKAMVDFQVATKMEGGNEFVERFIKTEVARRGMTVDEHVKECNSAIAAYDMMWEAAGQ